MGTIAEVVALLRASTIKVTVERKFCQTAKGTTFPTWSRAEAEVYESYLAERLSPASLPAFRTALLHQNVE